jgi:hypothetical protein
MFASPVLNLLLSERGEKTDSQPLSSQLPELRIHNPLSISQSLKQYSLANTNNNNNII